MCFGNKQLSTRLMAGAADLSETTVARKDLAKRRRIERAAKIGAAAPADAIGDSPLLPDGIAILEALEAATACRSDGAEAELQELPPADGAAEQPPELGLMFRLADTSAEGLRSRIHTELEDQMRYLRGGFSFCFRDNDIGTGQSDRMARPPPHTPIILEPRFLAITLGPWGSTTCFSHGTRWSICRLAWSWNVTSSGVVECLVVGPCWCWDAAMLFRWTCRWHDFDGIQVWHFGIVLNHVSQGRVLSPFSRAATLSCAWMSALQTVSWLTSHLGPE